MRIARALAASLTTVLLACSGTPTAGAPDAGPPADEGASRRDAAAATLRTFTSDAAGFDTHSYWLDTGREVVVFDAQFTRAHAEALLAAIRAATSNPIRWVVVTHPNPDKFNGAPVFQALGAKLVASRATAAAMPGVHAYKKRYFVEVAHAFAEAEYPALPSVDVTFDGELDLPVAGAEVKLVELREAAVASTQTVAHVPRANALVVGDVVHAGTHAWLEGGIVDGAPRPDLTAWRRALRELVRFDGATVYGGRGAAAPVAEAIEAQDRYLAAADRVVRAYVAGHPERLAQLQQGGTPEDAQAIRAELVAEFPTLGLAYLVDYGVYGLVRAVASGR